MTAPCSPLWMEMLIFSIPVARTNLPKSHLGGDSDSQSISTKLTFELQPFIEHWVIPLDVCATVPGVTGSGFTKVGWNGELCFYFHVATDRRGGWARWGLKPQSQVHLLSLVLGHFPKSLAPRGDGTTPVCWWELPTIGKRRKDLKGCQGKHFFFAFTLSQCPTKWQNLRQEEKWVILMLSLFKI